MEGKILWEQQGSDGPAVGRLVLTEEDPYVPGYTLTVDGGDTAEPYAHSVDLERVHLAGLWLAILEQADELTWASKAINREAAIRSVMKVRACTREEATKLIDGEKL